MTNELTVSGVWLAGAGHVIALVGTVAQALLARANLITGFLLVGAFVVSKLCERKVAASLRLVLFAAVFLRLGLPREWSSPLGLLGVAAAPGVASSAGVGGGALEMRAGGSLGPGPGFWLGLGYLVVVAVLLGHWIAARWALGRQLRRARPLAIDGATEAMAGARGAPVTAHPTLGPLVAGILRPRIVLPAAFVQNADPETLGFVLGHEAAHVARRDHWLVAAVQLATIVAWPVLPLWLAARQIRGLCELACDERVLAGRTADERRRYGEVLLRLSEGEFAPGPAALVPSFAWDLRRRLRALGRRRRWHRGTQLGLVGICGGVLLACSGAPETSEAPGPAGPPATSSLGDPATEPTINAPVLSVTDAGALFLDRQRVVVEDLESRLRPALIAAGTHTLRIQGSQASMLAQANTIMAAAKRAGATTISLLDGPVPGPAPGSVPALSAGGAPTAPGVRKCPPDQLCGLRGPLLTPPRAGSLDKEVVRGVIRDHILEVKACYETALARGPQLRGKVTATFTIGGAGKVVASRTENSTLGDPAVDTCIAQRVRGWVFPPPDGGGIVVVSYPFSFAPSDDGDSAAGSSLQQR